MTLEELFEKLKTEIITDYIVKLKYKYDFEEEYTYSNELLFADNECDYVWSNDWNEGQTDIEVLEYIAVDDVRENIHGEWQITDAYPHNVYCSECHEKFAQTHWAVWEDGSLPRNFCPNCGADMREKDNE